MKITHKEITALTKKHPASEVLTYAQVDAMADLIAEQDAEIKRQAELIAKYQKHVEIIKDDSEPSVGDLCIDYSGGIYKAESRNLNECFEIIQLANGKYAVRESDFNNNQQGE